MKSTQSRRQFIKQTAGLAAGAAALPWLGVRVTAAERGAGVAIVLEAGNEAAKSSSARWAAAELRDTLNARGLTARIFESLEQVPAGQECILASGRDSRAARQVLEGNRVALPDGPEALALARGNAGKRAVTLACGADGRGLVYALLDLADRANLAVDPLAALRGVKASAERPANKIRSVSRLFVSDVEDKEWFNDRAFWREYLTMLAAQRFNRFSLALGIGYDFTTGIRDCYFHFAYPFLVSVPGYDVRAAPLPDEERAGNLAMLKFISDEAALRGLHFQLGVWTHAYKWTNSPRANYVIEGLTDATQGPYSRDALRMVLEACPGIAGVTFRIHGESGVPEGSYDFWRMVFDGMVKCGRTVELDMHAKGMDQATIDVALATGLPVKVSPKFWAEHLGLPYMQASIRGQEMPPRNARDDGFFARSNGSRSFLRYSYGDLLAEDRRYGILHRFWPGTQRVLLWGDPAAAAAYGRAASFCGSDGLELFEPESFKGRKGSGLPGGREGYADETLKSGVGGWKKHLYTYRLWGRLTYNPAAEPETWQRPLRREFGAGAGAVEIALAEASRILPLVTTAHCPSAANNTYWPEMYLNMPIVDATRPHPYGDSPSPRRFGTVSPLDPQLFSSVDEFADELLKGKAGGKYSPAEVARWLEGMAQNSAKHLAEAEKKVQTRRSPEFRRLATDVAIQGGLGKFFAEKLRSGVLYALYLKSGHPPALREAIAAYRRARGAWVELAARAKGVYAADVTYGVARESRGHWLDRLPAMDEDIADMEKKAGGVAGASPADAKMIERAMAAVMAPPERWSPRVGHQPPEKFRRGAALAVELATAGRVESARLHYRRVNQAETWRAAEMELKGGRWRAAIPADCADSVFPLQYYFELRERTGTAGLHPGLGVGLAGRPYFVVRPA